MSERRPKEGTMSEAQEKRRVLVTLDGSEQAESALPFAAELAHGDGEIIVLRVVSDRETLFDPAGMIVIPPEDEFAVQLAEAKKETEASIAQVSDQAGADWRAEARLGDPAETILEAAREHEVEAIVMASTGKGAFARLALGSVADRVSRTSPVPVMIVHAGNAPEIKRLVAPTDGSELAKKAMPVAIELARRLGVPIEFIYVMDYAKVTPGGLGTTMMTRDIYDQLVAEASAAGQQVLDEAVREAKAQGVTATEQLRRGITAMAIIEATKPGDVVVMSSHGRSGFTRWLIGSVAEKLVRDGSTPVFLITAKRSTTEHVEVNI
jgi:nucleotide-binding universal stress UspA family protein